MSEEEVIKILQHYLKIEEFDNAADFLEAIDKIINLYNKEKEKNKKLNKYITDKVKIGKEIQTFINKDYVNQEYISKDKIREILKKYEKREIEYGIYFYKEIQELLEEK